MTKAAERPTGVTSLGADEINGDPVWDYEICYWRRCNNIRSKVAHTLDLPLDYVHKDGLDIGDVKQIWHIINELNNERVWNGSHTPWEYNEMRDQLDKNLLALEWLIFFMRTHKEEDYMVEFYDSY